MSRHVVIVDPYSSGAAYAAVLEANGLSCVAVLSSATPPAVYARSFRPKDFERIIVFDEHVLDELVAEFTGCVAVFAGCESGVELADFLAAQLTPRFANVAALAPARRHKGAMANALRRNGVATIPQICTADPDAVHRWIVEHGLIDADLVFKPPKSASTDGVTRVKTGRNWTRTFDELLGKVNRLDIVNDEVVVQCFLTGKEYVVDTVSLDSVHSVCEICRYTKIVDDANVGIYDCMDWVAPDDPECEVLVAYGRRVLDAVGIRNGAAHMEIMMTPSGPYLIEVAARPHGGGHPTLNMHATGDSQVARYARYLAQGTGGPEHYRLKQATRVVFLVAERDGKVVQVENLDHIDAWPGFHAKSIAVKNGDFLKKSTDLFSTLDFGYVVLSHPDASLVEAGYRRVRELQGTVFAGEPCVDPISLM